MNRHALETTAVLLLLTVSYVVILRPTHNVSTVTRRAMVRTTPPATNPVATLPPLPTFCYGHEHYSIEPPTMTSEFLARMEPAMLAVTQQWRSNPMFKPYRGRDVAVCDIATPECSFFKCVGNVTNKHAYRRCCFEHDALKRLGMWVLGRLAAANVRCALAAWSALGMVRHRGTLAPWSTVVELAVYPEDAKTVQRLLHNNTQHYFHVDARGSRFLVLPSKRGERLHGPRVEILWGPDHTEVEHVQRCAFYGRSSWCPQTDVLESWFGPHWRSYGATRRIASRR
jgi:hypothetical protein